MRKRIIKTLKWSEKYTKTDMVYLATGGFWLTLGQVVSSISALLLSIAFANLLPPHIFGTYRYVLSIAGVLSITTLPGVWTAITQSTAKGFESTLKYALRTRIKWGIIGTFISLIGAGYYFYNHNLELSISLVVIGIFLPFFDTFNSYDAYLHGKKAFKTSTKYYVVSNIISALVMFGTLLISDNLFVILAAYFLPWTLLRLYFLVKVYRHIPEDAITDADSFSYGKNLSVMSILNIIALNIDRIVIFHYLGAVEVALYSFAIAIPEQIKSSLKNIYSLALPKFANSNISEIRTSIYGKMFRFGLLVLLAVIVYLFIAPFIFKLLFPKYLDAVLYSQIFSISLLAVVTSLPMAALTAQKKTRELYQVNIYTSVTQIVLLFALTSTFGILGTIWSRVISRFLNLGIQIFFFEKVSKNTTQ